MTLNYEFTESTLENPLKALNKGVTQVHRCEQQVTHPVETVIEEDVSELPPDVANNNEMRLPVSQNLSQAMRNIWQTNTCSNQIKKLYELSKTSENSRFLDIPRKNLEIFDQIISRTKPHDKL